MAERFGSYKGYDPPRIPARVSINRNANSQDPRPIRIEIATANWTTLAVVHMSLDDFAAAVTGLSGRNGEVWVPGVTDTHIPHLGEKP